MLISPKYHCELAGEGIEYDWGIVKKYYRNIPLEEKLTKKKFHDCVRQAIQFIPQSTSQLFSAKARRYMMTYQHIVKEEITHANIQKFIQKCKSHRSVSDQDTGFIDMVWRDCIGIKEGKLIVWTTNALIKPRTH